MNQQFRNQSRIVKFLVIFYLVPLMAILFYANLFVPMTKTWILLPTGLLLTVIGALVMFTLVRKWEAQLIETLASETAPTPVYVEETPTPFVNRVEAPEPVKTETVDTSHYEVKIEKQEEQIENLRSDLEVKQQELFRLSKDNERYQRQAELVLQEFAQYKKSAQDQIEQKTDLVADYQQTMSEQKAVIENKQHQIGQLESKVNDLTYEIKTLLQLAELGNAPTTEYKMHKPAFVDVSQPADDDVPPLPENQVKSIDEAMMQLKRCIDIAQKITGSHQFTSQASPRMMSENNFAMDYRRLFDNLRLENGATVFFYSQKDNKMLFVNNQCKNLLGWTPDKFIQNFSEINLQNDEWKNALSQLVVHPEGKTSLMMRNKSGNDIAVQGVLGSIPTGLFKHNVIGVLY